MEPVGGSAQLPQDWTPKTIYACYSSVLRTVRWFADLGGIAEILPSPVAPRMEYAASKSVFLGSAESPRLVLPASNTYQKELAALLFGPVYCIAPCYRREWPSDTSRGRHLNVFFQIEFEFPNASAADAREVAGDLLNAICRDFPSWLLRQPPDTFKKIDEVDLAETAPSIDLNSYDEWAAANSERIRRPTWVLGMPQTSRPRLNQSVAGSRLSAGFDLLLPRSYGELLSGGLRDHAELDNFWGDKQVPSGSSAGFGIGLERLIGYLVEERDLRRLQLPYFAESTWQRAD